MQKIKLTNNMRELLSSVKGQTLLNYECELEERNIAYAYLRLNTSEKSIDISNEDKLTSLYGVEEEVAYFELFDNTGKTINEAFNLFDNFSPKKITVNEIINDIYIISEVVNRNDEVMEFDMGIVIETNSHKYYFTRDIWFNEFININVDKDLDVTYPIIEDANDWKQDKNDYVTIDRKVEKL